MPIIELREGEAVKIFGPAAINVLSGEIEILGKKFRSGDKAIIHKTRSYMVLSSNFSKLDISLGTEASIQSVEENDPYMEWVRIVDEVLDKGYERITIIGGVDCGKSSFSILLSNKALERGLNPAIIDSDIGQADIGPPGFISMAYPEEQVIWMRMLKPVKLRFIGDIRPQRYIDLIINRVRELVEHSVRDRRYPVIIDTDGWIGDSYALVYKYKMISETGTNALIVIGEDSWGFFDKLSIINVKTYYLRTPRIKRERSREERRWLRSEKYKEFLLDAKPVKIPLNSVLIINNPLFIGREISVSDLGVNPVEKVLYASKTPDTLYIVLSEPVKLEGFDDLRQRFNVQRVRTFINGFERNIYVSIVDRGGEEYPGIIDHIDFNDRIIYVRTRYEGVEPVIIKFSHIRLTEEYTEQLLE
jgi:polynucleotide 5'-hydroxyl-kinase GRC3/NOL9